VKRNGQSLDQLEAAINQLKLDYEIFFNGGSGQYPQKLHEQVDREVKRLCNTMTLTYAHRFRLNSLAARLTVYNELWQRNLRSIEQGKR
jgi:hypothetical protein